VCGPSVDARARALVVHGILVLLRVKARVVRHDPQQLVHGHENMVHMSSRTHE
jgi:hypothetical protein